jgi:hypothetical protein
MKTLILLASLCLAIIHTKNDKLTGWWQTQPSPKGNVSSFLFKENKIFEAFINKKPFTTGQYKLVGDVFTFTDTGCQGAEAFYKVIFFSNDDSLRFQVLADTCKQRREGMTRLIMGRIKN